MMRNFERLTSPASSAVRSGASASRRPWTSRMLRRVRESRVVPWGLGYLALTLVGVELLDGLGGVWDWSVPIRRSAALLLACALPPALVLSWCREEEEDEMTGVEAATLTALLLLALVVVRVASDAV